MILAARTAAIRRLLFSPTTGGTLAGSGTARAQAGWQLVRCRFLVPEGVTHLQPRLMSNGPLGAWADDFSLEKKFNVRALRGKDFPAGVQARNAALDVSVNTADGTLSVLDRRAGRQWNQQSLAMAKRYRACAKQNRLFKSLEEKRRLNPNVDRLFGAVNV